MHSDTFARTVDSASLALQEASRRSMETLLNCYCREVAGIEGQLSIGPLFGQGDSPASVHLALHRTGGRAMHIRLPLTGERLLTVVDGASATGNYRYLSPIFCKAPGKPWVLLDWRALAGLLLRELSVKYDQRGNDELLQQIHDSVAVTATVLGAACPRAFSANPLQAFVESEQSLVFGHPFHPAPKSRQGISREDMQRYSPEMGVRFALHYFAVRREYLLQQSVLATPCDEIVAAGAPATLATDTDFFLLPAHPWQARQLLTHPGVAAALRSDRIRDLGQEGPQFYPTSSIRTLFDPDNPYFYKCSLNVRITNCVRKNAVYELEGALQVTRIVRALRPQLQQLFPGLAIMEEPAFLSAALDTGDAESDRAITEGFGLILRQGFGTALRAGVTPLLAGALFGNHVYGAARIGELLDALPGSRADAAEAWFSRYVGALMYPVLHCYFAHGVVFEPHLQNVVIGVAAGRVRQVFLRDFEGVKLVQERFGAAQLEGIAPRAREALWYSAEQGWKRIAYCLFVNNFCEAIHQIAAGSPALQNRLWAVVRHHLHAYQSRYGDEVSARRINALLNGEPFPGKANLINRFFRRPDRASGYVPVNNPLGTLAGDPAWS